MRASTSTLFALFALTHTALGSLSVLPGFTTTSLFLPFATSGAYITFLGSNTSTTTWGLADAASNLRSPSLTVTLDAAQAIYSTQSKYVSFLSSQPSRMTLKD